VHFNDEGVMGGDRRDQEHVAVVICGCVLSEVQGMLLVNRHRATLCFQGAVRHHLTTLYIFTTLGIIPATFCTQGTTMDTRVQLLRDWMDREERGTVWVAKKVGRTKAYISHILHGRLPLTKKLARDLRAKLGIPLPVDEQASQNTETKPGSNKRHIKQTSHKTYT
jgi:hypothetical protein